MPISSTSFRAASRSTRCSRRRAVFLTAERGRRHAGLPICRGEDHHVAVGVGSERARSKATCLRGDAGLTGMPCVCRGVRADGARPANCGRGELSGTRHESRHAFRRRRRIRHGAARVGRQDERELRGAGRCREPSRRRRRHCGQGGQHRRPRRLHDCLGRQQHGHQRQPVSRAVRSSQGDAPDRRRQRVPVFVRRKRQVAIPHAAGLRPGCPRTTRHIEDRNVLGRHEQQSDSVSFCLEIAAQGHRRPLSRTVRAPSGDAAQRHRPRGERLWRPAKRVSDEPDPSTGGHIRSANTRAPGHPHDGRARRAGFRDHVLERTLWAQGDAG